MTQNIGPHQVTPDALRQSVGRAAVGEPSAASVQRTEQVDKMAVGTPEQQPRGALRCVRQARPEPSQQVMTYKTLDGAEHEAFSSNDLEPIELVTFTDLIRAKHEIGRPCVLAAIVGSSGKRHFYSLSSAASWLTRNPINPLTREAVPMGDIEYYAATSHIAGRLRFLCSDADLTEKTKAGRLGNSFLRAEFDNDPTISELVAAVEHSGGTFEPKSADPLIIYGALSRAVACGAIHAVHKLFSHVDLSVGQVYYLLALAVSLGEPRIVRHIIKSTRVDLDVRLTNQLHPDFIHTEGRTLLACAVYHRHSDVTQVLLALGANPTVADDYNKTPLQYAAKDTDVYRAIIAGIARWGSRSTQMERR